MTAYKEGATIIKGSRIKVKMYIILEIGEGSNHNERKGNAKRGHKTNEIKGSDRMRF